MTQDNTSEKLINGNSSRQRQLSVSMMCVDFGYLAKSVRLFEEEQIDYLHIDVMDGYFVPNLMLGVSYVEWLRRTTHIPFDIHLMVKNPVAKLNWFPIQKDDIVTVHVESDWNILSTLIQIRKMGAKAVLAISPQTSVSSILHLISYVDGICVMLVIPGFSGQMMVQGMEDKVRELSRYRAEKNASFFIEVDGHVSEKNVNELEAAGADIFVAGTSLLGKEPTQYRKKIHLFYNA